MEIFVIGDQLQKLGEVMSDGEILTMVQNALPKEWGSFTSSINGKEEAMPFQNLWSLCKIEETRLKSKIDIGSSKGNQAFAAMSRRNKDSVNLVPRIKEELWTRYDALDVMNLGIIKGIVLNLERTRGKRKKPMS